MMMDGRFAVRWTGATFAGWTLGFLLVLVLIAVSGLVGLGSTQFPVGLGMGLGVGLLQDRRIARYTGRRGAWLTASAVGMAVPFLASDLAGALSPAVPFSLPVCVVLGGFAAGLLQWRVLSGVSRIASGWIAVSTLGWTLAASTVVINDHFLPRTPGVPGALIYVAVVLLGGVLLGLVGGGALPRILAAAGAAGRPVESTVSATSVE